jgi:hypothetical protein
MLKRTRSARALTYLSLCLLVAASARAQDAAGASRGAEPPPPRNPPAAARLHSEHRFWDRTNLELFAGVAAVRALDYASTRHFRSRGANEILLSNSIVDNKPLFAGIEVAATAASIGVSYLFHRTGHHKLERWVSIVHIGAGAFGDARNYTLKGPGTSP